MDYDQLNLIAETKYLHYLWHRGPPRCLQPPYCHPQPPCYRPRKRREPYPSGNSPASSSEVSPKPIFLPPPKKKCPSRGKSIKETANEGNINGSSDVTVPCHGELCEEKSKTDEIVKEGHTEGSMNFTEVSEEKGKAEVQEVVNEVNMDYSIPVTVVFEGEEGKVEERANDGNMNGSSDVTVPCHGEVYERKGKTDEIVKEGHMEGSMHVAGISEEKGKTEEIVNEVNMEYSIPVTVVFEGEEGKVEAKAFHECEDGSVDANNMVGDEDLCLSDVQLLQAEDIATEGYMEGSMHITEEIFNEVNMEGSTAATVIPEVEVCKEQNKAEAKAVLEGEDALSDANNLLGGKELCFSDVQLLQEEKTVNDGDMKSSMGVIVLGWGDVCEEKSNAEETAPDGDKEGSMNATEPDGDKEGPMNATDSCQHDAYEAEIAVNEGEREASVDVAVSCQGDTWKAEKIVEDMNMKSLIDVTAKYEGEETVNEVDIVGSKAVTVISDDKKTDNDGKKQDWVDATVSCLGEASKEKGKAMVLQEDGGARTNDSTSNGDKLLLKKCSENISGLKLSEARFVLYDLESNSHIQQVPTINLADTQALEQFSPAEYTGGVEPIKNCVWGNTFFVSKRTAKLLGHILAGGFQFTPSLPNIPASSSQPKQSARKPKPHTPNIPASSSQPKQSARKPKP